MGNFLSKPKAPALPAPETKTEIKNESKVKYNADGSVTAFGAHLKELFLVDEGYRNMNNGSFGTIPKAIQQKKREYQTMAEARPDPFIRYEGIKLLDESRAAIAKLLNAPLSTVVLVPNATTGINTVLRALAESWASDGQDEILYFNTIYGGCGKTVDYVVETSHGLASSRCIQLDYPCSDADVLACFAAGVATSRAEGKRPKVAIFDVVSSLPGVNVPWTQLVAACRAEGVLSLVDGAQGVGMVALDLGSADPDFFTTNAHKWLHVPRGCAVLYVPERNQDLLRSTLPTSHGYVPASGERWNPLPEDGGKKSAWEKNFEFVGTLDNAPYFCVKDSIAWRERVLGGEERVIKYLNKLAREGGDKIAEILGTEIMENEQGTLTGSAMVNVALPLLAEAGREIWGEKVVQGAKAVVKDDKANKVVVWIQERLIERSTFLPTYVYRGRFWCRVSAQVFLGMEDFEWAGQQLRDVLEEVKVKDWEE